MNAKLLVSLAAALLAAGVFWLWPRPEPDAYKMNGVKPETAAQITAFVDSACRLYLDAPKNNREKRMLREAVRLGDPNLIRDFFAAFDSIDAPDFAQARVTEPETRPGTYRVDFTDRKGAVCVVAESYHDRLVLVECRRMP